MKCADTNIYFITQVIETSLIGTFSFADIVKHVQMSLINYKKLKESSRKDLQMKYVKLTKKNIDCTKT